MTHFINTTFVNVIGAFGHTARFAVGVFLFINMALSWTVASVLIPVFGIAAVLFIVAIVQESIKLLWKIIA